MGGSRAQREPIEFGLCSMLLMKLGLEDEARSYT